MCSGVELVLGRLTAACGGRRQGLRYDCDGVVDEEVRRGSAAATFRKS
jgi:hypothetical protein